MPSFLSCARSKALAVMIAALMALCAAAWAAESDKGVLADLISKALSSPSMSVSIGAVDGVLSSDASISDIVLSDPSGPWLKIDKVRLVWNRLALFSRRLEVDQLTIGHLQVLRRPLPSETAPPPELVVLSAASKDIMGLVSASGSALPPPPPVPPQVPPPVRPSPAYYPPQRRSGCPITGRVDR